MFGKQTKNRTGLLALLVLALVTLACGETATSTLTPTATPRPTNTPKPTDTPTNTPKPTNTPRPTNTPTPTLTPTNTPTSTPLPTNTPRPTLPPPTATPQPTDTPQPTLPPPTATPQPTAAPTEPPPPPSPTEPPAAPADVQITYIYYDGQVPRVESDEYAAIKNLGGSPVNLSGWRLNAGNPGQDFWFPGFELQPGQECRVYTNENHPESCGFSFGNGQALWKNSGDCGHLYDASGAEVSSYCY